MQTTRSAQSDSLSQYVLNIWQYRTLVWVFAIRDLKVKYAQTILGLTWSIIQPVTTLAIYTVFFDLLMHLPETKVPYSLFAFSGIMCWNLFSYIINSGSTALMANQHLISKIYFPKIILPLSKVIMGLVDFCISFIILIILMVFFRQYPDYHIILLPAFVLLLVILGLTVTIWLTALSIRNRDLHHIIPFLVNFGVWLTPVFFPVSILPPHYHFLIYFNPMAGIIEGFRWTLFSGVGFSAYYLLSFVPVLILFFLGLMYFNSVENDMADIL